MGFRSNSPTDETANDSTRAEPATLDGETVERIENALEGTVNVDVSKLSADDKLALLIERYNRMIRDSNEKSQQRV